MKIAKRGQMKTLYNQKQKNLEKLKENADHMAEYLKWKFEDLLLIWKAFD